MKRHAACILANHKSWIELGNNKAYRFVMTKELEDILDSDYYKDGVGKFWLPIKKVNVKPQDNPNDSDPIATYEMPYITHVTRYTDFTPRQFVDSMVFLCNIFLYSFPKGVYPDTHLWNVVYYKGKPWDIDIGDFKRLKDVTFFHLLEVLSGNRSTSYPYIASDYILNVDEIKQRIERNWFNQPLDKIKWQYVKKSNLFQLRFIRDLYKSAMLKNDPGNKWKDGTTHRWWDDYNQVKDFKYDKKTLHQIRDRRGRKSSVIYDTIIDKKPKTLFDAGCNLGLYSFVAENQGCKTIGVDTNYLSIDKANHITKENNLNCTFVSYDIMKYNTAHGKRGEYIGFFQKPSERYKCEAFIAAALIHHLNIQGYSVLDIIKRFSEYAEKWMLVEWQPDFGTNIEDVIDAMKFCSWGNLKVMDSWPEGRKWIYCEK